MMMWVCSVVLRSPSLSGASIHYPYLLLCEMKTFNTKLNQLKISRASTLRKTSWKNYLPLCFKDSYSIIQVTWMLMSSTISIHTTICSLTAASGIFNSCTQWAILQWRTWITFWTCHCIEGVWTAVFTEFHFVYEEIKLKLVTSSLEFRHSQF